MKKSKRSVEDSAGQEPSAVGQAEAAWAAHHPVVEACARAAVRSALGLRQVFLVRSMVASVLEATAKSSASLSEAVMSWKFMPRSEQFDLTERVLELALADTRADRTCLELFVGQVKNLHSAYDVARAASPVASFKILRCVSRGLLADSSEEVRAAWKYVCLAWGKLSSEAPKIALWQPDLDATVEEKFKFDEATRSWKYQKRDGSVASVEVTAAFYAAAR